MIVYADVLAKTGEAAKSGPIGLAVILVLCVLCYFLFKSMSKHLRTVRERFPNDGAGRADRTGQAASNQAASNQAASNQAASNQAASNQASSNQAASQPAAPDEAPPNEAQANATDRTPPNT
jgi:hypothetical protein